MAIIEPVSVSISVASPVTSLPVIDVTRFGYGEASHLSVPINHHLTEFAIDEWSGRSVAVEALAMIAQAMSRLEVGDLGVVAFGQSVNYHPLGTPWTSDAGRAIMSHLTFIEERTDVAALLSSVNELFTLTDTWNLHLILSDGICHDHAALIPLLNAALAHRIIVVFVILDATVCDINHVAYTPTGIKMMRYLETFPFQFYVGASRIKNVADHPSGLY